MNQNILIIEDEVKIAEIVSAYLNEEGYGVTVAHTGTEGLKQLKEQPDLIILDLMLPDMDGEDICRFIRQDSVIPIIMLTAKSHEDERVKGLLMGADDYMVKPFSPKELVARVKTVLRRVIRKEDAVSFNRERIVINKNTHEVKKAGDTITLTPTEYNILVVFTENPDRVLSREQLARLCRGYDFEGYERTIDAHIKNLRRKVETDSRNPEFIKTIFGVGYKFTGVSDEE